MNDTKTILWALIFIILMMAVSEAVLENEYQQCRRELEKKEEILNN